MQFDVITAIQNRASTRRFYDAFLDESKRVALEQCIQTIGNGPFLSKTKFYLVDLAGLSPRDIAALHLPKDLRNALTFIVGTVLASEEYNLEDYGYVFEKIILYATSLQLGTSWLSLGLNRNRFAELVKAKDFEIIPCISPVGLPLNDIAKKPITGVYKDFTDITPRKPKKTLFFEGNLSNPIRFDQRNKYHHALDMVRLAPSVRNKQPWRILFDPISRAYHFYLEHTMPELYLPQFEQVIDLQRVDMGVAMCHFEMTLRQIGIEGQWKIMDPNQSLPSRKLEYISTWIP